MKGIGSLSKLGALAAIAVAGAGIAGCGSSNLKSASSSNGGGGGGNASNNASPSATFARAASVSSSAAGEKMTFTMSGTVDSQNFSMTGTGAFNRSPVSGQMNMNINAAGQSIGGMEMLIDNNDLYMKFPASLSGELSSVTGGKQWMSINLNGLGSAEGIPGLSSLMSGSEINPTEELKLLADSSTNGLTKVGTATINGISTTEYKANLDLSKEAAAVPASEKAAIKQLLSKYGKQFGSTTIPVEVWIDGQDLVRQMSLSPTISTGGQSVSMNMKIDITDYGQQAAVTPPPASQVFDMTSLIKQEASSGALGSLG